MDTLITAAAFLAVAAALIVAQFRVLVVVVDRLLAGGRKATDEAQLEAIPRMEARMERMEHRLAAMAMPAPRPRPSRANTLDRTEAPPAAQQPRRIEAPQARDDAMDRPSSGGFGGTTSTELRPVRLHRVVGTASPGPLADEEPGGAKGAGARPIVRHASVQMAGGPGAQPQIKGRSTRTCETPPPPRPAASSGGTARQDRRDRNDFAGLPLSPLPTPISSGASPRALRTPLPAGKRRLSSPKSKPGKPLSSGALFYARVVERMFEEEHPGRRLSGPAGRRLTMGEVHESIIGSPASSRFGSPASSRSDLRTRSY